MKDDLISRLAAIDAIIAYGRDVDSHYLVSERIINESDAIEALTILSPAQPRWIPVTERLPEEDSDILVTYVEKDEKRIVPVNYGHGTWFDCIFDMALNPVGVLAWMPLPEPYKEEEDE